MTRSSSLRGPGAWLRQILVPGVGQCGQAAIAASIFRGPPSASDGSQQVLVSYLERAGVSEIEVSEPPHEGARSRLTSETGDPDAAEPCRRAGPRDVLLGAREAARFLSQIIRAANTERARAPDVAS